MDIKELRDKTPVELQRLLAEARNRLRDLRFKVAAKQLTDVREIRETRKVIAQILTLLGQEKLIEEDGKKAAKAEKAEAGDTDKAKAKTGSKKKNKA